MDDVRAFNYKSQDAIDIFAEERVQKAIKREFSYVFAENQYPGIPRMRLNLVTDYSFTFRGLEIIPIRVRHMHLEIYGFRIGNFAYITDANYIPEESKEKLIGVKYLVINACERKSIFPISTLEAIDFTERYHQENLYNTHKPSDGLAF